MNTERPSTPSLSAPKRPLLLERITRSHAARNRQVIAVVAGLVCLALMVGVITTVVTSDDSVKPPLANQLVVSDLNYELLLPEGWKLGDNYSAGAGLATAADDNSSARMTIFVTPLQQKETASTHIDTELEGLARNGGFVTKQSDEQKKFGVVDGRMVVAMTAKPSDPNTKTYRVYAGVTHQDVLYNLDVSVAQAHWPATEQEIRAMLDSLVPKSTTFKQPNAL